MNNYCNNLDFRFNAFDESFDYRNLSKDIHSILPENSLNKKFLEFINSLGMYVSFAEVFYRAPSDGIYGIHTDNYSGDYVKINYIFGGKDSTMRWYKVKPDAPEKQVTESLISTPNVAYDVHEVDLVYESQLGFPSLIQVGIPHNVYNPIEERWAVSLAFRDLVTKKRISMEDACNRFRDFII